MAVNRLAEELLRITELRPEPWVSMARYCEMKADDPSKALEYRERASYFADKALQLDKKHVEAHCLKGFLALQSGKPHEAVNSFREVYFVSKELSVYQGGFGGIATEGWQSASLQASPYCHPQASWNATWRKIDTRRLWQSQARRRQ